MLRFLYLFSFPSLLKDRTIGRRKVPAYVLWLSLCAATGGLMFGYDIGISGGVTVMDDFLCHFFPSVLEEKIQKQGPHKILIKNCNRINEEDWKEDINKYNNRMNGKNTVYCIFGDQRVQLFTSSLYLSAMVATFFAGYVSRQRGRKMTIIIASIFYLVGVVLNIASGSIPIRHHAAFCTLIFGRIMLGIGVGFGNQAIPLFISEIAPSDARGSLNYLFQLNITIGIFIADIVNWKTHSLHPWGWRLSLGLAGVPSLLLTLGSFFLVETPSSFVQRGLHGQAQKVLSLIRRKDVDTNLALQDIILSCNANPHGDIITDSDPLNVSMNTSASSTKGSKKQFNGLFERSNRPPLLITIFVQFFQQLSGINVVMLYAPVIFTSFGSGTSLSLLYVLIIGSCNVVSTLFSIVVVDRIGRRRLILVASGVMFFTQFFIGIILIGTNHKERIDTRRAIFLVALVSVFVSAFACSWGPLAWLISTEIFPLACRSEGQSVTVFFNMLFTFLIAHTSLSMLCTMTYGIFFFFALWAAIMGSFSFLFLPETMNMDIEIIVFIWSYHKFWKNFVESHPPSSYIIPTSPYNHPSPSFPHLEMNNIKLSQQDSLRYT